MATEFHESTIAAISYGLNGGPLNNDGSEIWAIFVDDHFEKFVRPPAGDPEWGSKGIEVGDFTWLISSVNAKSISVAECEKETLSDHVRSHVDPGLTATILAASSALKSARASDLATNQRLRNRFNASRLRIGMTEDDVESIFKEKPLKSGQSSVGAFKLYGSSESLDVTPYLRYSNVVVVYQDQKVIGIYSGWLIPGGEEGVRKIGGTIIHLTARNP